MHFEIGSRISSTQYKTLYIECYFFSFFFWKMNQCNLCDVFFSTHSVASASTAPVPSVRLLMYATKFKQISYYYWSKIYLSRRQQLWNVLKIEFIKYEKSEISRHGDCILHLHVSREYTKCTFTLLYLWNICTWILIIEELVSFDWRSDLI